MQENTDFDKIYFAIIKDSDVHPVVLGTGLNKDFTDAKEQAILTVRRLREETGNRYIHYDSAIMKARWHESVYLSLASSERIRIVYCDAKIHEYGREDGYEKIEFYFVPETRDPFIKFTGMRENAGLRKSVRKRRI